MNIAADTHKQIHLVSLGCARNQVDSEVMLGQLTGTGFSITTDPSQADVIIVNTCSFIEAAINESIDQILELARYKKEGRCRRLIITGCLPERFREDIVATLPEVDLFLGTGAYNQIVAAVNGQYDGTGCLLPDPDSIPLASPDILRKRTERHSAYLKIAEGCSKHCTYCIIPKLRGRHKSRPQEAILTEAGDLLADGVKELVLVAQDTTAYGHDLSPVTGLSVLLENLADRVARQTGQDNAWIRLLYGHPESIDEKIIRTIALTPGICSYFDIPIQHASNAILKKMGRRYEDRDLLRLFDKIRRTAPDAALRTTVIVGFPGETEQDFQRLYDFIQTVRFEHLGVFTYSDAEDLPSHRLPGHVALKLAEERRDRLMEAQMTIAAEQNRKQIGKVVKILIEESPESNVYIGRTALQAPEVDGITYVHAADLVVGDFIQARITDALAYDLVGEPS